LSANIFQAFPFRRFGFQFATSFSDFLLCRFVRLSRQFMGTPSVSFKPSQPSVS
jgi:hypothetical protein